MRLADATPACGHQTIYRKPLLRYLVLLFWSAVQDVKEKEREFKGSQQGADISEIQSDKSNKEQRLSWLNLMVVDAQI